MYPFLSLSISMCINFQFDQTFLSKYMLHRPLHFAGPNSELCPSTLRHIQPILCLMLGSCSDSSSGMQNCHSTTENWSTWPHRIFICAKPAGLHALDVEGICGEKWGRMCLEWLPEPSLHEFGVTGPCQDQLCGTKYYAPSRVFGKRGIKLKNLRKTLLERCVVVDVDATGAAFQHYSSGVSGDDCGVNGGHQMLALRYGEENDEKYWKLQNFFGEWWYVVTGQQPWDDVFAY